MEPVNNGGDIQYEIQTFASVLPVPHSSPALAEKCHMPGKQSSAITRLLIVRKVGIHVQHGGVEVAANIFELKESLVRQGCRGGSGKARDDFAQYTSIEPNRSLSAPFADQEGARAGTEEFGLSWYGPRCRSALRLFLLPGRRAQHRKPLG